MLFLPALSGFITHFRCYLQCAWTEVSEALVPLMTFRYCLTGIPLSGGVTTAGVDIPAWVLIRCLEVCKHRAQ